MPGGARVDAPRVLHHVMVPGIEGLPIFVEAGERRDFVGDLAATGEAKALSGYAWALLSNHVHLLVRTGCHRRQRDERPRLTCRQSGSRPQGHADAAALGAPSGPRRLGGAWPRDLRTGV